MQTDELHSPLNLKALGRLQTMTTIRHQSHDREAGCSPTLRHVIAKPSTQTRAVLRSLSWWQTPTAPPVRRRVFPEPVLPVIIDLAGPGWFLESATGERGPRVSSLGVGLHQRFGVLNAPATPSCVLLELDPIGAFRLFGVPLHELSDQTFDVVDLLGAAVRDLRERLESSCMPLGALSLTHNFIVERLHRSKEPSPAISWAWQTVLASSGNVSIDALAKNVGWSRKHLRQRFLEQVGASPKAAAQLVRFSAAMRRMRTSESTRTLASTATEPTCVAPSDTTPIRAQHLRLAQAGRYICGLVNPQRGMFSQVRRVRAGRAPRRARQWSFPGRDAGQGGLVGGC